MLSSTKGSKFYSIAKYKCPICHEGQYWKGKNPYDLKNFHIDREVCSECGHKYEIENGFYYGAMYVSYGISVAFAVATFMAIYVLFPETPYYIYIIAVILSIFLFMPISFRTSRLIWMNMFSSYGKKENFNK